jgi:RNA-directed DNA polymerase
MDWEVYKTKYIEEAQKKNVPRKHIEKLLEYAKNLYDKKIPIIYNNEHLSFLLGFQGELLRAITNDANKFYRSFSILKHNGKERKIREPYPTLKEIQYWILRKILQKVSISKFAKAYKLHRQLKENVRFHIKQPVIIKLDVQDFFNSITQEKIIYIFKRMGYTSKLSGMLARLCCLDGKLPQGAPTSPYLSNLYCRQLDKRLGNYLIKSGFRYTRYSDDITISGNPSNHQVAKIIKFCELCLCEYGLRLQTSKTQILRSSNRQMVTGVVLNTKMSSGNKKKHNIRQEMYYIKKYGLESHMLQQHIEKQNYLYHLLGQINWILYFEKDNREFQEYKSFLTKIVKENNKG